MSSYFEPCLTAAQASALAKIASGTTSVPIILPNLAIGAQPLGGAAWVYGAWVQVAAAAVLTGHALWQAVIGLNTTANRQMQFQVGVGGAGAEVVIGTFGVESVTLAGWQPVIPIVPMLTITANARVAVRVADDTGGSQLTIKLGFMPVPLT